MIENHTLKKSDRVALTKSGVCHTEIETFQREIYEYVGVLYVEFQNVVCN